MHQKNNYINYYIDQDFDDISSKLPDIIHEAQKKADKLLEPTIDEKFEIRDIIKDFVKKKRRKVYGGFSLNEFIIFKNPDDAIYTNDQFYDIEFYSTTPVIDLVELCNLLYEKKYKYISGKEAHHEETYSLYVNFQQYCDITYMPTRIYNEIKTSEIDGIMCVDPQFMLIDYFRMINQPITAAEQRWDKAFCRMYKILKYYPLEYYNAPIKIDEPDSEYKTYINDIIKEFMHIPEIREACLITGFAAYNFYINFAIEDKTIKQSGGSRQKNINLEKFLIDIPYVEIISVNYRTSVELLYKFIRDKVYDKNDVTLEEFFPLYEFIGYSAIIKYKGIQIVHIFDADGYCVPNIIDQKTNTMYVTYQYLIMTLLIFKFRAHVNKNKNMYFNYNILLSNLITARNYYLTKKNLGIINNTIFGEFKISCIGSTIGYVRSYLLRGSEKYKKTGKGPFKYEPESFFNINPESQEKFDPSKWKFKNRSGNQILNPRNLLFYFDENKNIRENITGTKETTHEEPDNIEPGRITKKNKVKNEYIKSDEDNVEMSRISKKKSLKQSNTNSRVDKNNKKFIKKINSESINEDSIPSDHKKNKKFIKKINNELINEVSLSSSHESISDTDLNEIQKNIYNSTTNE